MRIPTNNFQPIGEILADVLNSLANCPLPELSELLAESVAVRRQADATQPPKSNTGAQIGFSFLEVSE